MIPEDWSEWTTGDHIYEAQRLCDDSDYENEITDLRLRNAQIHAILVVADRIDQLTKVLEARMPVLP